MARFDPSRTVIFLATLVDPLKNYLEQRYEVISQDIVRTNDVHHGDWMTIEQSNPTLIPQEIIIDTWCLANCDELWGGASNITLFALCLNPDLKFNFLPFLANLKAG